MSYEALRSRVTRARKPYDIKKAVSVVQMVLDAVREASKSGVPDNRGVVEVDISSARSEADRLGVAGCFPLFAHCSEGAYDGEL